MPCSRSPENPGLREHEAASKKRNYGAIRVAFAVPFSTVGGAPVK
jgi:hypothetical protein